MFSFRLRRTTGLLLVCFFVFCLNTAFAEVKSIMKLNFDPAVEGDIPSLLLSPSPDKKGDPGDKVRVSSYVLEGDEEKTLSTQEVQLDQTVMVYLKDRGHQDILGVNVEKVDANGNTETLAAWRALYRPKKGILGYRKSKDLKRPDDFQEYWDRTRKELAAIPMNPEITPVPDRTTETGKLYRVKLQSFNNIPIVCWYYVPKEVDIKHPEKSGKKYPAIQIMPGWGAEEPPIDRTAEGYITLSVNPRTHGPSKEYFTTPVPHHVWNIDNPETYYYRVAYMDCMRGIDFLVSRPEVDSSRIGVEGGSQGGAFTLAMAALDQRVACAAANVPYISNFPDFALLATNGSGRSFGKYMKDPDKGQIITRTLAYIDVSNLAPWIRCPTMACVGLQDRVCPPLNGIVALNRLPKSVPHKLVMDPKADHEVTPLMRKANKEWFDRYLKEKK